MSFFTRPSTLSGPELELIHRPDNEPLLVCCRYLAERLSRTGPEQPPGGPVGGGPVGASPEQLAEVVAEFERALADPALAAPIRAHERPWPDAAPRLLALMLATATAALRTDPSLTALIADTVLRARRDCAPAWALRAQAHEQWGDLAAAISAHQEFLRLAGPDQARRASAQVRELREVQAARHDLASALNQAHTAGVRLPKPGTGELRERLPRPIRQDALEPLLEDYLTDLTRLPMPDLIAVQDLVHAVVRCRRTGALSPGPMPVSQLRRFTVLRLSDLRARLTGRSICLVSDTVRLRPSHGDAPGRRIDAYDLVTRFAPFQLDPALTGTRTDLLVGAHDEPAGWDQPAELRMVLADDPRDWLRSIRHNLVPGAQQAVLDKALRRPAHQAALLDDEVRPAHPSSVFHVLRLLDHLDVTPRIDLIGFTLDDDPADTVRPGPPNTFEMMDDDGPAGPAPGARSAPGARPAPDAHPAPGARLASGAPPESGALPAVGRFAPVERDWIRAHARQIDEQRISLR